MDLIYCKLCCSVQINIVKKVCSVLFRFALYLDWSKIGPLFYSFCSEHDKCHPFCDPPLLPMNTKYQKNKIQSKCVMLPHPSYCCACNHTFETFSVNLRYEDIFKVVSRAAHFIESMHLRALLSSVIPLSCKKSSFSLPLSIGMYLIQYTSEINR